MQCSDPSLCDWLRFDGVMPSGRKNMLLLAMISLLVGAVLAQRFKIMILIPATGIMLVAAVGAGVAQAHTVWWTILMIAAAGASMQVGYIIGLGIRPHSGGPHGKGGSNSARHFSASRLARNEVTARVLRGSYRH